MTKLRLVPKIGNVLPFRKNKSATVCKVTFNELQVLAEQEDFCQVLDGAGLPNPPGSKAFLRKWTEGKEFDAS